MPFPWLLAAGVAMQIFGSSKEAKAQKEAGQYNAKIYRMNASIKRKMAQDSLKRGDTAEAWHRMDVADVKADQRARMLAGGQTITGSNSRILDDTAFFGELDALTIRQNAAREAWGHETEAKNYGMQAELAEKGGQSAANATIITGAAQAAGTWYSNA